MTSTPQRPPRKHNKAWKDATRNDRTREREAKILEACKLYGFPSKSALLTALMNGAIKIERIEKIE